MASAEEFREWLTGELKGRGWSVSELARRSKLNQSHLLRILSGERNPGPHVCQGLSRALGIPPEEVMRRAGLLPRPRRLDAKFDELKHYFLGLPEEDQERVLVFVRALHNARPHEK